MTPVQARFPGAARLGCLLEQSRPENDPDPDHCQEPPGLMAWEIWPAPQRARIIRTWIPDGAEGRVLHAATLGSVLGPNPDFWDRTLPTAPLLVYATPFSLRVLYHCTPSEAVHLGDKLAILGNALGARLVSECAPAVLLDLIRRYIDADPRTEAMLAPHDEALETGELLYWVPRQDRTGIFYQSPLFMRQAIREVPMRHKDRPAPVPLRCDRGQPTVLVPLGLMLSAPGRPVQRLREALDDQGLWAPLLSGTPFDFAPVRAAGLLISLLAPVRAESWRQRLGYLRDDISERLGTAAGCCTLLQEDFAHLMGRLAQHGAPLVSVQRMSRRRKHSGSVFSQQEGLDVASRILYSLDAYLDLAEIVKDAPQQIYP